MIINHNIPAEFAQRLNIQALDATAKTTEKLSSGLRINRSADDAAGLAISEKMRGQIRGLKQAERNVLDGISFVQTTEGYLGNITNAIQRLRELAIQSANGTYTTEDRMMIQVEVSQLVDEVDRVAKQAQFNEINMLTGRFRGVSGKEPAGEPFYIHLGPNMDQRVSLHIENVDSKTLGLRPADTKGDAPISLSSIEKANRAIATMDSALASVSKSRANLGAYQNRLEFAAQAIRIGHENIQSAESRIRDADMAQEAIYNTRNVLLTQSSVAMLAQANLQPQLALKLLQ